MGDRTQRMAERRERAIEQVSEAFDSPYKTLWGRILVSLMVAVITGIIAAGLSTYWLTQENAIQLNTINARLDQIAAQQNQQFQELSNRMDVLADDPPRK